MGGTSGGFGATGGGIGGTGAGSGYLFDMTYMSRFGVTQKL
jgi:hypothetical protein